MVARDFSSVRISRHITTTRPPSCRKIRGHISIMQRELCIGVCGSVHRRDTLRGFDQRLASSVQVLVLASSLCTMQYVRLRYHGCSVANRLYEPIPAGWRVSASGATKARGGWHNVTNDLMRTALTHLGARAEGGSLLLTGFDCELNILAKIF